ncbi:MAG: asparagine synthase (glutamine-hydrolyzing) [Planctomycetota bacterium]|nr:asparagine synthase (glutamine-hydrolyzing) [Planctomycetota bacterium]
MCGIVGFIASQRQSSNEELTATVRKMADSLQHRGPDDRGEWVDARCGVALGHRRLSIIDLSPHGHQPMTSASGRYQIVYNGEIYNHGELRRDLASRGHDFRGHSDTEVLVEAIECWGIEDTVRRANGMFALGVWDSQQRALHLVRDRIGIKPLYYGVQGDVFLFGSELKALRSHSAFAGKIDRNALALFLQHSYIPAPYSIYEGIHKLPAGTILTLSVDDFGREPALRTYWSMNEAVERGTRVPFQGSEQDAIDELERVLRDSIRLRMEADVPVGAFLSGGIDSSLVVSLMQAESSRAVKTYSIGFHEEAYNEAHHARAVAEHLGTEHTEWYITSDEARDVIPRLPAIYDEPFADSSQIPTFLLSQLTRQHVTVSLSGDGGDELFGGYERYAFALRIWNQFAWIPKLVRRVGSRAIDALIPDRAFGVYGRKARTLARLLAPRSGGEMYANLHTHWKQPEAVVIAGRLPSTVFYEPHTWPNRKNLLESMMYVDSVTYLPDDILVKVDRASMAVGLEARVPLLDYRFVELAWRLPSTLKVRNGQTKWPLRQILDRHVPRELIDRPKVGFGVPIDEWLRGPLRDWAEDLLSEERLRTEGVFAPAPVREKWSEHLSGAQDWHYYLWDVLVFQSWLEAQSY